MDFDLNDYTRRVKVGFCKIKNPTEFDATNLDPSNFESIRNGEQEKSPYALRDTYIEFTSFAPGTYLMYIDIQLNGKAQDKSFSVNCYGPSKVIFEDDLSTTVDMSTAG